MMNVTKPLLIYCYDAYCGWCYGFSPVITRLVTEYADKLDTETFSGGMILPASPVPISATAGYIASAYKNVEELTGIKFGQDYLWHIFNPGESDWYPNSEKPAIAMCIFKKYFPSLSVQFAADLQFALHGEGRDLTDDEAYRHLLDKYGISHDDFYRQLKSPEAKEEAYYEFALVKQLKVNGFPTVFIQSSEYKFEMIARGYTPFEILKERTDQVLASIADNS